MSRACDLGLGDIWGCDPGSAPECLDCGNPGPVCSDLRCAACSYAVECCDELPHPDGCECEACDEEAGIDRCGYRGCRRIVVDDPMDTRPIRPCRECRRGMREVWAEAKGDEMREEMR